MNQLFVLEVQPGRTFEKEGSLKQTKAEVTGYMETNWHDNPPSAGGNGLP